MKPFLNILCVALVAVLVGACRGQTSTQPPIAPERNMYQQQRYNPQARSNFFKDGRSMRTPVAHTFSREMNPSAEISNGELADGSGYVLSVPDSVVGELGGLAKAADRGQERFGIYCTPCHDGTGSGQGVVFTRSNLDPKVPGMPQPSNLHDERIRHMPDGQLFATITHGVRNMPAYYYSIPTNDRWAIVTYVRALQLSQAGE